MLAGLPESTLEMLAFPFLVAGAGVIDRHHDI